jgi:hypothetical protein
MTTQTCGNRQARKRRAASDALDRVNEELLSASWEVDFLAKVATEETPAAEGEERAAGEA